MARTKNRGLQQSFSPSYTVRRWRLGAYIRLSKEDLKKGKDDSNSTPGVSGWPPVSSAPVSCGKGNRPACVPAAASLYRGYLSCVPSILLSVAVPPKRFPAPFLRRVPALARSPQLRDNLSRSDLWTKCPEAGSLQCFPSRGIPFRTVILFSRCRSSMN